ncbi:hypothetical protein BGZ61DRAFT_516790 [Ilyonectria robusta]|uniref:uncharacterized protein n=1 Tax=Ilyonectria robusta TaxID=1079257 RepID=UPI001E8EE235|nr:uncharacterized protein BGZ61DRAFT_516790 [Ilyonectria robusta]KAH8714612.1 hypothetical protein BGZ61DRAFT_516790 [Ilyonectria robusta]
MASPVTRRESRHFSFTSLPTEIRDLIYTNVWAPRLRLHVFFKNDRLVTAACLGAQTGDESSGIGGPYPTAPDNHRVPSQEEEDLAFKSLRRKGSRNLMKARLHSTWGNHYRCEEDWNPLPGHISTERNACISLLLVNKTIYAESIRFLSQHLEITITDTDTALYLNDDPKPVIHDSPPPMIPRQLLRSIRSLNVTLFGSVDLFIALTLARDYNATTPLEVVSQEFQQKIRATGYASQERAVGLLPKGCQWHQIWPGIAALPHLVHVNLWMDHGGFDSWSNINERAILEPLRRATWSPEVELVVYLPKIASDNIVPSEQFNDNDQDGLHFRIVRRARCPDRIAEDGSTFFIVHDMSAQEQEEMDDHGLWWDPSTMSTERDLMYPFVV